eukprot:gene774-860_t
MNDLHRFLGTINDGGFVLVLLGLTGAVGQVFVFVTISKFGALNCALIGLGRKILSLLLSFFIYGHTINAIQTVGLVLAVVAMIANFYEKGGSKRDKDAAKLALEEEVQPLMGDGDVEDEDGGESEPKATHWPREGPIVSSSRKAAGRVELSNGITSRPATAPKPFVPPFSIDSDVVEVGAKLDNSMNGTSAVTVVVTVPGLHPELGHRSVEESHRRSLVVGHEECTGGEGSGRLSLGVGVCALEEEKTVEPDSLATASGSLEFMPSPSSDKAAVPLPAAHMGMDIETEVAVGGRDLNEFRSLSGPTQLPISIPRIPGPLPARSHSDNSSSSFNAVGNNLNQYHPPSTYASPPPALCFHGTAADGERVSQSQSLIYAIEMEESAV